jgi:zinc/manganese transport system substrate-binding protein
MRMSIPKVAAGPALGAAWALMLMLAGCASGTPDGTVAAKVSTTTAGAKTVNVVASTDVYADIAQSIGGAAVHVTSFISDPDQDPHSYEANAQNQLAISKADVVIENGGGYDDFIDRMVKASHAKAVVLNVVDISGKKAGAGQELNEHVWYDFPTINLLAGKLVAALAAIDGKDAARFQANAQAFTDQVHRLVTQEERLKASYGGGGVAITEPVPLYLLEAVGLRNETPPAFSSAVELGNDMSALVLRRTLDLFAHGKVKALVYNEQTSGPITEQVKQAAEKANVPVVPVTETLPAGKSYLAWMTANLHNLKRALGAR